MIMVIHFTAYGNPQQLESIASTSEKLEICQFIIENVTDIDPENVDGKTPIDHAKNHKSQTIIELLKAKRKKTKIGSNYEINC